MKDSSAAFFIDSSTELTQIDVEDLKIGMFISDLDRPWQETNFLFQGFELKTEADIAAVQAQCRYVFVDVSKQTMILQPRIRDISHPNVESSGQETAHRHARFKEEIYHASHVHRQVSTVVKSFMQEVSLGNGIDVALAKEAVAACVDSIITSPDVMLWLTQLKKRDEYTSQHSMNVAILAIALGRQLNFSTAELNHLGMCGMMHDMGKMRVPLEVLNKPARLNSDEAKIMKAHTTLGWKLLMSSHDMYGGAIDAAYSHHERLDGTGYPRGLKAEQISQYAKIIAIADMYDAVTSDRVYQDGRTHLEAISLMAKGGGTHLDSDLTTHFIECLGIYPPGSLIEMSNGEVAVVIETDPNHKLKPKVIFVLDENKQPRASELVDLAHMSLDKSGQPYKIIKMVRAEDYNIDLAELCRELLL